MSVINTALTGMGIIVIVCILSIMTIILSSGPLTYLNVGQKVSRGQGNIQDLKFVESTVAMSWAVWSTLAFCAASYVIGKVAIEWGLVP